MLHKPAIVSAIHLIKMMNWPQKARAHHYNCHQFGPISFIASLAQRVVRGVRKFHFPARISVDCMQLLCDFPDRQSARPRMLECLRADVDHPKSPQGARSVCLMLHITFIGQFCRAFELQNFARTQATRVKKEAYLMLNFIDKICG